MQLHNASEAKSAHSAVYDCLVPYDNTSMETTLRAYICYSCYY